MGTPWMAPLIAWDDEVLVWEAITHTLPPDTAGCFTYSLSNSLKGSRVLCLESY